MNHFPSTLTDRHLESKAFGVLLSAMFVLTLAVAGAAWWEASGMAAVASGPAAAVLVA